MQTVAVFFGGKSSEHDISVITGVLALNSLDREKFSPVPVYVTRSGKWTTGECLFDVGNYKNLQEDKLTEVCLLPGDGALYEVRRKKLRKIAKLDCALNCMHGLFGEDGSLAGLLALSGVAHTASDMFGAAAAMDKADTKLVLRALGVRYVPYVRMMRGNYYRRKPFALKYIEDTLGYPVIVKPANLGSSIGVTVARGRAELADALACAFRYDGKAVVEKALERFTEINCAAYRDGGGIRTSECERPVPAGEILSFTDKYLSGAKGENMREFPARIPKETSEEIKRITRLVYRKLGLKGVVRADFMVAEDGTVYFNELNTVPGSLAYYLFSEKLSDFTGLLTRWIDYAVAAEREKQAFEYAFPSKVLEIGTSNGGKRR